MNNTKVEFVYQYLKYLNRWNKSASLVSVIQSIEKNVDEFTDEQINELYSIAKFEYEDTVHAFKEFGDSDILTMEEIFSKMTIENREEKINYLIND
jgi:transcription initiation factor IIE alpha subunit